MQPSQTAFLPCCQMPKFSRVSALVYHPCVSGGRGSQLSPSRGTACGQRELPCPTVNSRKRSPQKCPLCAAASTPLLADVTALISEKTRQPLRTHGSLGKSAGSRTANAPRSAGLPIRRVDEGAPALFGQDEIEFYVDRSCTHGSKEKHTTVTPRGRWSNTRGLRGEVTRTTGWGDSGVVQLPRGSPSSPHCES